MEEQDSPDFDDFEMNYPPKLSFEEMNLHLRNTPYHILKSRSDILKTLYYYSKDSKFAFVQHFEFREEAYEDHPAPLLVPNRPVYPGKRQEIQVLWD